MTTNRLEGEEIASSPDSPDEMLHELAKSEHVSIRLRVAANPNASENTLELLSKDEHSLVRSKAIQHPRLPTEALRNLSQDRNPFIVSIVAGHPQTPQDILKDIAEGNEYDPILRRYAARNPALPAYLMEFLSLDPDPVVRAMLAERLDLPHPYQMLSEFAYDKDPLVRTSVAEREDIPLQWLEYLAEDNDNSVRAAAQTNPVFKASLTGKYRTLMDSLLAMPDSEFTALINSAKEERTGKKHI